MEELPYMNTNGEDIKSILKQWLEISDQNDYYLRYGRDPGEEALDEEHRLYMKIREFGFSTRT
jgi:2',3'-cyclic-nucleotide 2'-phosphodiesterase (5'-nucleotidase family)